MRRRINGGRKNEKGLDRCMPVSAKRDRRQGLYLAYVYSNKALVFSVKGDAQAVTYVAACAIVGDEKDIEVYLIIWLRQGHNYGIIYP